MLILCLTVAAVVLISALCSMTEAALYSVPWTHIESLRKNESKTRARKGEILYALRSDINRPIAAVLTLNTVANTAGASMAGAFAAQALGDTMSGWFAGGLTLLILAFGEIIPKTMGVTYSPRVAEILARPLLGLVVLFTPFIWLSGLLTKLVAPSSGTAPLATEEDIRAIASLSRRTGTIQAYEEDAITNILALDQKYVHEIMTPRTMVFSLPTTITVEDAYTHPEFWHYSRIPVYGDNNEDIVGIVMRRDIAKAVADKQNDRQLNDIMQPIRFVHESLTADKLLRTFLGSKQHLFAVLDEFGGLAGVISLEDILEEMLGQEIVDETDVAPNLRELAKQRSRQSLTKI